MIQATCKIKQIYLFFFVGLFITACSRGKKIDVSNIPITVKIERFDHDFDNMRTKPMAAQADSLQKKYGVFYNDFINVIIPATNIKDTAYFSTLREIFNTGQNGRQPYLDLKHEVDSVYPGNMEKQSLEIADAFKHIKYYYPAAKLPANIYTYFSGFQAQTMIGDNYFAIGLDMFLGANSKFYPALTASIPRYLSRRYTPEYITARVSEGVIREDLFPESDDDKTLLSKMIYNGKIMYFMDQVLPDAPDTIKIGYTVPKLKWCQNNEAQIWGYFLEENLLYETDYQKIQHYLTEAPFTPELGEHNQSAPKLGVWTGWQIVKQYMDKHPEVTLPKLMSDGDAQKILNESKYRPK